MRLYEFLRGGRHFRGFAVRSELRMREGFESASSSFSGRLRNFFTTTFPILNNNPTDYAGYKWKIKDFVDSMNTRLN